MVNFFKKIRSKNYQNDFFLFFKFILDIKTSKQFKNIKNN